MPRDAMGNIIPGSYNPDGSINRAALGRPMNPSPRAARCYRAPPARLPIRVPHCAIRPLPKRCSAPMPESSSHRRPLKWRVPPLRQGQAALAGDLAAQQAAQARMQAARGAIAAPTAPAGSNSSDRAAQILAMQQDQARMQAARGAAVPPVAADRQAQLQQQQADLIRQRQAAMQRPPIGLGTAIR